jgi:hypothetical protein
MSAVLPYLGLQDFPLVLLFVFDAQGEPNTHLAAPGFVTSIQPQSPMPGLQPHFQFSQGRRMRPNRQNSRPYWPHYAIPAIPV